MPKVSVVIPIYNAEKTLDRCILSILQQSFKDYEIIAINDGSTDNSSEILNSYKKNTDNLFIYNIDNGGPSNARNFGIAKAKGEYIAFVDSDDYIDIDYLSKMVLGDYDFVACKTFLVYDSKTTNLTPIVPNINKKHFSEIYRYFDMFQCSKIFKLSIINDNNIKFRNDICYGEDGILVSEYLKYAKSINLLDYYGYYYVKHSGDSLSTKPTLKVVDQLIISREIIIEYINSINDNDDKDNFASFMVNDICLGLSSFYAKVFYSETLSKKEKIKLLKTYRNNSYYQLMVENKNKYSQGIMLRIYRFKNIHVQLFVFHLLYIIKKFFKGN